MGLTAFSFEHLAKNLVLMGVASLTIHDPTIVKLSDLSSQVRTHSPILQLPFAALIPNFALTIPPFFDSLLP